MKEDGCFLFWFCFKYCAPLLIVLVFFECPGSFRLGMPESFVESALCQQDDVFEVPLRPQNLADFKGQEPDETEA